MHLQGMDAPRFSCDFLGDDVVAEPDALVADVDGWTRDELADVAHPLAAERARQMGVRVLGHVVVLRRFASRSFPGLSGRRRVSVERALDGAGEPLEEA